MGSSGVIARKGYLYIDFRFQGIRCREYLRLKPTKPNIRYATALRETVLNEIALGTFDYAKHFPNSRRCALFGRARATSMTVGEALETWLESHKRHIAHSTAVTYRKSLDKHLIPTFGQVPLRNLTTAMIRKWIADSVISAKSVNNTLTPLRQTLGDAFEDGLIDRDPSARIKNLKNDSNHEPDPFTTTEIQAILSKANGQVKNLIQFAFWTGLRTSELVALRWEDVDIANKVIRIRRAKVLRQIKTTKTAAGKRDVRLLPQALEALSGQKAYTSERGEEIFLNPNTDEPWVSDKALREVHWKNTLETAGVRYRYPYQTRHTYASMMLSAGENPMWVANQMGHADMVVLLKRYARWIPDNNPDAGAKMAALWEEITTRTNKTYLSDLVVPIWSLKTSVS